MVKKFVRRGWHRYVKIGKHNKKKQTWRKPKGRDNPVREKKKGYGPFVKDGYKSSATTRGKINGKIPVVVYTLAELHKVTAHQIAIIGKVGKKRKMELVTMAKEKNIPVQNVNIGRYLKSQNKVQEKQ